MRVVLKVYHNGHFKMVGKVFPVDGRSIFLHEESGNQSHFNLDCPGGIDEAVVDWLDRHGVQEVHHHKRGSEWALATAVTNLKDAPLQTSDGRSRRYLDSAVWEEIPFDYKVPWITDEVELGKKVKP